MAAYRSLQRIFVSTALFLLVVFSSSAGIPASAQAGVYHYANGITLAAAGALPIYKINTPVVNPEGTQVLARTFDAINDTVNFDVQQDTYNGHNRFTGLNGKKNTILEQFGATGGFYAYEPQRAFGDGSVVPNPQFDPVRAQVLACQFLLLHAATLVPASNDLEIPGVARQCGEVGTSTQYKVSTETLTSLSSTPGAAAENKPIRIMVTIPINVKTGQYIQTPTIPLGGPGGHISMIFDDTTDKPQVPSQSLDSNIVGLQAVAMPAFGRSLSFSRTVPALDPAVVRDQVLQQVKEAYPDGQNIQVPTPDLIYFVSDAAEPQSLLEPELAFSGVSLELNGQLLVLKDIFLPAAIPGPDGLGPTVTILSPRTGALHLRGGSVTLRGEISAGKPPYNYEWRLEDGTLLGGGTLNTAGQTPELNKVIPSPDNKGTPGGINLLLVVTDDEGVTRQQVVSLISAGNVYLPGVLNSSLAGAMIGGDAPQQAGNAVAAPALLAANYRFGVEYGSDYPPYGAGGSDLGGVPPDANGLSSGLMSLGWPRVFNWYNALAWERDWRDCSLGGSDCTYGVDRADFVYYSGHGSNGGLSVPSNGHDSSWFDGSNARYQNARWVAFSSCLTLRAQWPVPGSEPIRRWLNAFQGAHMLLGFNSLMADIAFGPRLVDNMRIPSYPFIGELPWAQRTIAEAWVQTAFQMNAGKPAYLYATSSTVNPSTNKLPKADGALLPRPYPVNWYYWVWWND